MSFSGDRASGELLLEGPFKFPHVVLDIAVNGSDGHELVGVNSPQSLDVDRSSLPVNAVVALGVVLKNLFQLFKIEILLEIFRASKNAFMGRKIERHLDE